MHRTMRWSVRGATAGALIISGCATTEPITHPGHYPAVAPSAPADSVDGLDIDTAPVEPMHNEVLAIDLQAVVHVARATNTDILLARKEVEAAQGRLDSSVGQLFPTIAPTVLFEIVNGDVRATRGNIVDVGFNTFRSFLAVDWILNPGRVYYEIVASKRRLAASEHQERAVVIQTIHDAVIQFYDLVLARSRIESAQQSLREAGELLRINDLRAKTGTGLPADRLRAQTHLAERQQDLTVEMNRFYHASVALALTLRLAPTVTLLSNVERLPPITLVREEIPIEELLSIAVAFRPDLERLRALVGAAKANRSAAFWGGFGPTLATNYLIGGISGHNINGVENLDQDSGFNKDQRFSVGGSVRLSVSTFGDLRVAGAVEEQTKIEAQAALDRVKAQVVNAQQSSRTNMALTTSAREQMEYAQQALGLIQKNLVAGMMTTLDVLEAEDSLAQARLRYAQAVVRYNQSQVDLLAALGVLNQDSLFPFAHPDNAKPTPADPAGPPTSDEEPDAR